MDSRLRGNSGRGRRNNGFGLGAGNGRFANPPVRGVEVRMRGAVDGYDDKILRTPLRYAQNDMWGAGKTGDGWGWVPAYARIMGRAWVGTGGSRTAPTGTPL